jgi:Uncharacterised protein family UPF0547
MGGFIVVFLLVSLWVVPILICWWLGKFFNMHNSWLWGLFLGWIGVLVLCFKLPFRSAKEFKKAAGEVGLATDFRGGMKQAAIGMKRMTGEVDGGKKCPACAETVQGDANVCRYCGHNFKQVAPAELA